MNPVAFLYGVVGVGLAGLALVSWALCGVLIYAAWTQGPWPMLVIGVLMFVTIGGLILAQAIERGQALLKQRRGTA